MRWLSSLTPVTYFSKLPVIRCVAAFLQLELFWVETSFLLPVYCRLSLAWRSRVRLSLWNRWA
ncbi:hypothetical protein B5M10_03305 [Pluralibacter gergoviae]|nr:hypothetical protein B5M10_03305 [Pluralibacter gergoviae]